MEEIKQRRIELDIARAFAIMCVVLCHATETIYSLNRNGWINLSIISRIFMIFSFTIGRLGVPIFLFLTGALILKKKFQDDNEVYKFYKKNLIPLIIVNLIWIIIYNIYFWITNKKNIVTGEFIIKELLLLKKVPLPNMWYFPMIIGLYIGLPFVSKIVKAFSRTTLYILMAIIFISAFIIPMINIVIDIIGIKDSYTSLLNVSFLGGTYGIYVVLGYYLDNNKEKKTTFLFGKAIVCFIITCAFQMLSYCKISKSSNVYNVWYNFPFLLICAAYIFKMILNIDSLKNNEKIIKIFTFISKTSLATFFLHIIIQRIIAPQIIALEIIMPLKVILLFASNFITCLLLNFLLCKIKIISKYVMLVKN